MILVVEYSSTHIGPLNVTVINVKNKIGTRRSNFEKVFRNSLRANANGKKLSVSYPLLWLDSRVDYNLMQKI